MPIELNIESNIAEVIEKLKDLPRAPQQVLRNAANRALVAGRTEAIRRAFGTFNVREKDLRSATGPVGMHGESGEIDLAAKRLKWSQFLTGRVICARLTNTRSAPVGFSTKFGA